MIKSFEFYHNNIKTMFNYELNKDYYYNIIKEYGYNIKTIDNYFNIN